MKKNLLPLSLIVFGAYLYTGTAWAEITNITLIVTLFITALLATLLIVNIYLLIAEKTHHQTLAMTIAAIIGFTPPVLIYSTQVTGEILSGLLILYSYRRILQSPKSQLNYILLFLSVVFLLGTWFYYPFQLTFNLGHIGQGLIALFLDRSFGLFPYTPIYIFVFSGFYFLYQKDKLTFWTTLAIFLIISLVAASGAIYVSPSPVGRFLMPILPLLALPLAETFYHLKTWSKLLFFLLSAWSLLIGRFLIFHPDMNYTLAYPKFWHYLNLNYSVPMIFPKLIVAEQYSRLTPRSIGLVLLWLILITIFTLIIIHQSSQRKSQR